MLTAVKAKRLLVSRQDPQTRRYVRVGVLSCEGDEYVFEYDAEATRALPGMPLGGRHSSETLFPVLAERIMHPERPDHAETLMQLGLGPEAGPFEILAVSGGRRTGDTYEVTPLPEPGEVEIPFLVHGIRHLTASEQQAVLALLPGQELALRPEPGNVANTRALLVTSDGTRLGYVPDPLLEFVHPVMGGEHSLTVLRVNDPQVGVHMRLLVQLRGIYPG